MASNRYKKNVELLPHEVEEIIIDYLYPHESLDSLYESPLNEYQRYQVHENLFLLQALPINFDAKSLYRRELTLFENVKAITFAKAKQAAHYVLMDEAYQVERLIQENAAICNCVVEIEDENGNKIKGNLLQLAAMTGNFNPREPKIPESHYGMFEKLSSYYPINEVIEVAKQVNSIEWKAETERRMQPYREAIATFMQKIIEADAASYNELKLKLKPAIETFRNTLQRNSNEVITSGYIFDLQVIADAAALFKTKLLEFGGWYSHKSNLFWIVAAGSCQAKASKCDKRIIKKGITKIVSNGQLPDRRIRLEGNNSYSFVRFSDVPCLFFLGIDFFWGLAGPSAGNGWGIGVGPSIQNLCRAKASACGKFVPQPQSSKQPKGSCLIL